MSNFMERFKLLADSYTGSDQQLAKKIGVSKQTISAWKTGKRSPKKPTIIAIAEKCNVRIEWLMGLDVPREKPDAIPYDYEAHGIAARKPEQLRNRPSLDEMMTEIQRLKAKEEREQELSKLKLSPDEERLIENYRALPKQMRLKARRIIAALADDAEGI